ncbi:MAG: DNA-directed RNA polymerase subunit omega [Armatimonadetes bacterium]|nr:DNA-directed RNA polymerase subunit omega [Armatimonadota bacterium]
MPRYKDVHDLAGEVGGMYALVVAAAKRAKQLREGRQAVVESGSGNMLTVAIRELLEGKVIVRPPGAVEEEPAPETEIVQVVAPELQEQKTDETPEADGSDADAPDADSGED